MVYHLVKGLVNTMAFSEWLKQARDDRKLSLRELARRTNGACTFGYLSQLENSRGGKKGVYQPDIEIVDALAKALDKNIDEARLAAGYAPTFQTSPPQSIPELIEALERLGIEAPLLYGGYPDDPDGEGFREVLERIYLDIQLVVTRLQKGRKAFTIPQTIRIDEEESSNMDSEPLLKRR